MSPEQLRRVYDVFQGALQTPTEQRPDYVADQCGDDTALRDEVLELLGHRDSERTEPGPTVPLAAPAPTIPGYEILSLLGRGGMGVVYKARHIVLDRIVALKTILAGVNAQPGDVSRFSTEARAVAQLQHPGIVQIFEIGEYAGQPFFALEYLAGGTLAGRTAGVPQPANHAARLVRELAGAVQAAHASNIIHRDLKPANVLLTLDGSPKISDFGLAKRLDADAGQTFTGAIMGTASYMSPEQAEGRSADIGPRADVYSLGAILYELLTGRPPFRAANVLDTLDLVRTADPVAPSQLEPTVPRDLETICLKCLHKDPARRYESAQALADDLGRFLDGRPILARPVSNLERGWRWCRRNPVVASLSGGIALLLIVSVIVAWYLTLDARAERDRANVNADKEWENLYYANMNLAGGSLKELDPDGMKKFLQPFAAPRPGKRDPRGWEWHAFTRFTEQALGELPCESGVLGLSFSHDGKVLAVASPKGGLVRFWDTITRKPLSFTVAEPDVRSVAFSADGRYFAVGGKSDIGIFAAADFKALHRFRAHAGPVTNLAFNPDGKSLASASAEGDQTVAIWDVESWKSHKTYQTGAVHCLAFSESGKKLAWAGWDGAVHVATPGDEMLVKLTGITGSTKITSLAFVHAERWLGAASNFGGVTYWDLETRNVEYSYDETGAIAYDPIGKRVAAATGTAFRPLLREGKVEHMAPMKDFVARETTKGTLPHSWNVVGFHGAPIMKAIYSPDGTRLATAGIDGIVKLWSVGRSSFLPTSSSNVLAFDRSGQLLCTAPLRADPPVLEVWNVQRGDRACRLSADTGTLVSAAFSKDGKRLAALGSHGVAIWELNTARRLADFRCIATTNPSAFAFQPDGNHVVWFEKSGSVMLGSVGATEAKVIANKPGLALAFSPDGRYLAIGHDVVEVWDFDARKLVQSLATDKMNPVSAFRFAMDGRLASGHLDGVIHIWEGSDFRLSRTLRDSFSINSISFNPDGKRLACSFQSENLATKNFSTLWDVDKARVIAALPGCAAIFSPTGGDLAVCVNAIQIYVDKKEKPDEKKPFSVTAAPDDVCLLDGRPASAQEPSEREAEALVRYLIQHRQFTRQQTEDAIRGNQTISEEVRRHALKAASRL